jgi:hypothetical protein
MQNESTIFEIEAATPDFPIATQPINYPGERRIEPGEFVYVYDDSKGRYIWQLVNEVKTVNGRQKIRVDRTDFFFDEGLVSAVAYLTGGGI